MRTKIIGVSVAVILSLAAILLVSTVPYFILEDIPIEVKEYTSQKIVRTLTPTETIIVPETHTLEIKEFKSSPIVEKTSEPSLSAQSFPFEAFAIGNTVNQIKFLKYSDGAIGAKQHAFDSNNNFFTARDLTISYFDRGLNTKTTWTLPNLGSEIGFGMTTDSAGNVYFGVSDNLLTKLVPSTNTFIQVQFLKPTVRANVALDISSTGEVLFMDRIDAGRVNFDTGEITTWRHFLSANDMVIDSNDNMYFVVNVNVNEFLFRLNPNTNVLKSWLLNSNGFDAVTLAIYNDDIIFIYQEGGVSHGRIQKVDITNNVLEEWVLPTTKFRNFFNSMAVDSAETVYFLEFFTRFVPSTGEFTQWKLFSGESTILHVTVDSNDDLWIAGNTFYGKVFAP